MANVLDRAKQEAAIRCLIEGNSIRSTERIVGAHRDTIMRLMVRVGTGCARLLDERLRGLNCRRIEVDEIWGYVGKKQRHVTPEDDSATVGDVWTFVAIDAESKLVPAYRVGKRDSETARAFMMDLHSRLARRVQLSADGLKAYVEAVDEAFGPRGVDFAQVVKSYEAVPAGTGRYSPPRVKSVQKNVVPGAPDLGLASTSYVERQNLTMRMKMRRLTRLTNAFSKKRENLDAAVALHFADYNFVRVHQSLRVTPAMEAGVTSNLWTLRAMMDAALEYADADSN